MPGPCREAHREMVGVQCVGLGSTSGAAHGAGGLTLGKTRGNQTGSHFLSVHRSWKEAASMWAGGTRWGGAGSIHWMPDAREVPYSSSGISSSHKPCKVNAVVPVH